MKSMSLVSLPTPIAAVAPYAATYNAIYAPGQRYIVAPSERIKSTIKTYGRKERRVILNALKGALKEFARNNPQVKQWANMMLPIAATSPMTKVFIDTTLQRELNIWWVIEIISKFKATRALAIQVYIDSDFPDLFIAWDGQHTLMALHIIAKYLGIDPATITVPVSISQSTQKKEMRENLLSGNTADGKREFTLFDQWQQHVFGVRRDSIVTIAWRETERKQQYLEQYNLFVTGQTSGNVSEPGAITNAHVLNDHKPKVIKHLARYLSKSTKGTRTVDTIEIHIIAAYFSYCLNEDNNIELNDTYVDALATLTDKLFGGDFSKTGKSPFWEKATIAYQHWYAKVNNLAASTVSRNISKTPKNGLTFLVHQLRHSFQYPVPLEVGKLADFIPATKDLF